MSENAREPLMRYVLKRSRKRRDCDVALKFTIVFYGKSTRQFWVMIYEETPANATDQQLVVNLARLKFWSWTNKCFVVSFETSCSLVNSYKKIDELLLKVTRVILVTSSSLHHWFRPCIKWTTNRWRSFSTICIKLGNIVGLSLCNNC